MARPKAKDPKLATANKKRKNEKATVPPLERRKTKRDGDDSDDEDEDEAPPPPRPD